MSENKLTDKYSARIFGLAAWYKINITLIPIPISMPYSIGRIRHAKNVANPGSKSDSVIKLQEIINYIFF